MIDLSALRLSLQGKPVAVLGLGKSGLSVFAACRAASIETVLWDDSAERREEASALGGAIGDLAREDMTKYALLCQAPGIPPTHPVMARARSAGVEIAGDIELFHRALPFARTIGITGTNGKSTTTALTGHILKTAGFPVAVGGNIGEPVLSLPMLPLQGIYVLEMSSYQLDLCPSFAPEIALLVNLSPDHLERHGTMEGYAAAKARIFRGSGTGIVSLDDPWSAAIYGDVANSARKDIPVSCQSRLIEGVCVSGDGILRENGRDVADLKKCPALRGAHNWQNAAMAAAAALAAGVSTADIVRGLETFPGLAHRQNVVAVMNGVSYINDSKATNDAASAVALAVFDPVYWIAGGKSKGGGYALCEKHLGHVRHAFLIGAAAAEMSDWLKTRGVAATSCGTLERAVQAAHDMAQQEHLPGAAVLLSPACASFDQFRSFEHRGAVFSELAGKLAAGAPLREGRG